MKIRKIGILSLLIAFVLAIGVQAAGEYRTFTTPDGRSLEAKVLQYSERTGKVQLERADGKKIWTLPTVFIEENQVYVRKWIKVDQFMSSMKFKIDGDSDKGKKITQPTAGPIRGKEEKTPVVYTLVLENRTDFSLKDLRIEYQAFIKVNGYEGRKDEKRVDTGSLTIPKIPAGGQVTKRLKSITLIATYKTVSEYSSYTQSYSSYDKRTTQDQLKGFWVRVYGPSIDGQPSIREWCYPSDTMEKFAW